MNPTMTNPLINRPDSTLRTARTALRLVWSSGRGLVVVILALTIVTSLAIAAQLLIGRELLNLLSGSASVGTGQLAFWLALLGIALLVGTQSQAASSELRAPLAERVQRNATEEVLDVATSLDLEAFEQPELHDKLARARLAAGAQSSAIVFGLITILSTVVISVGIIAVIVAIAPELIPIAVLGYAPIALVGIRNNRASHAMEIELTELARQRSYLELVLTDRRDAKEVRAYGVAPTVRVWYADLWNLRIRRVWELVRRRLVLTSLASVVTAVCLVAALGVVFLLSARGSITLGDAAAAIVGLQQLSSRLQAAGSAFTSVHAGVTFMRDFESFVAALPVIRESRPTAPPPSPPSVISVDRVGYRYPGAAADAVRDVSFEIRRGQVIAIVGANGSGKTTLTKVICGLLHPTRGTVAWDGVDIGRCDPERVRAQIAPVFQDYATYLLTIRQAVGLGDPSRLDDENRILDAISRAGLSDFVSNLPRGLDTQLGKAFTDGIDLSQGQWQRLAIARAFFRDAPVVILDEPSASLDPRAEADLFDLLQSLGADRIVLFVSHRFATVRSADLVMVLDQGEIVQMGSHDELMLSGGIYRDLFTLQAERYGFARG